MFRDHTDDDLGGWCDACEIGWQARFTRCGDCGGDLMALRPPQARRPSLLRRSPAAVAPVVVGTVLVMLAAAVVLRLLLPFALNWFGLLYVGVPLAIFTTCSWLLHHALAIGGVPFGEEPKRRAATFGTAIAVGVSIGTVLLLLPWGEG